jgi:hypothetical protein
VSPLSTFRASTLLPLLVMGCEEIGMAESWQLDRLRVLGVRAEVADGIDPILGHRAEPRPGETTLFSSLIYVPKDTEWAATSWLACLPGDANPYGCVPDPEVMAALQSIDQDEIDFEDPEQLAALFDLLELAKEAGFIGLEPIIAPEWLVPADALDDLDPAARQEGKTALVNVNVIPVGAQDETDLELAFKRVPVSEAITPNHNPDFADVLVADQPLGDDAGFTGKRGYSYRIEPVLAEHHIETYTYRTKDGRSEWRVEEPYFSWYAEAGEYDQPITLFPHSGATWTAPKKPGLVTLFIVVRDRRGGMAWHRILVNVL